MRDFFGDTLRFLSECVLPILAFSVLVGAAIVGVAVAFDVLECRGFERGTGIETRWEWGCYAKVDGKWLPKKYVYGDAHEVRVK